MWMPTHVQVTVQKATDLITKGKNGTNDCFVTIALGKTKYQTSVKKKASPNVEWHEECELPIPEQGNTAEIILTVLHHNFGIDEFLGRAVIPLNTLDTYQSPKNKAYVLQGKPGKSEKERGKLEVKIAFHVKSGSLNDLSKKEKHKSSIGQLSHMAQSVGGSLLSLGSNEKRKGIKKLARSIGSKMHLKGKKHDDDGSLSGSFGSLKRRSQLSHFNDARTKQTYEDADPGVVSDEEEDFMFDDLSHKSSGSSLNQSNASKASEENFERSPGKPSRLNSKTDEWELKLYGNKSKNNVLNPQSPVENVKRRSWESPKLSSRIEEEEVPPNKKEQVPDTIVNNFIDKTPEPVQKVEKLSMFSKFKNLRKERNEEKQESLIIGGENEHNTSSGKLSNEIIQKYDGKSREDLILLVTDLQSDLDHNKKKLKDLEDYLDELLLRVMETQPKILQNPYVNCKLAHKKITG